MSNRSVPVSVSYGQYHLHGLGAEVGEPPFAGGNGLIWVNPDRDAAVIMTGITDGDLRLHVAVLDHSPPLELDAWEEIVEVSMNLSGQRLWIRGPMDLESDTSITLPARPEQQRSYRLRVHARGRDHGRQVAIIDTAAEDAPVEKHQVLIWPAPPTPEERLKLTDTVGEQNRSGQ